ncbi:hypothetical protein PoB_002522400 [Plakobranchus ocellatus]|uniref:Uncharacterized protein n=1 Tax=Plakobranchus ocellatus TaxID=259542 RepID=A0AAV3ZWC2_9GAST|nr:hypothetical protein PoB_002522400 [Plakobranchus ocellatus]
MEEMTRSQFVDYKTMFQLVKNLNIDDEGNQVKLSNVRELTVYGNDAQALNITYEYCGTQKRVDLQRRQRSSGSNSGSIVTELICFRSHLSVG